MRLLISTATALTVALVAAGPASNLSAAPKAKNIPVTITFADGPTDSISSDNGSSYRDGVGGVVAYLASANRALIFSTNAFNTAGRTLQFLFDDCLWSGGCNAPRNYLNEKSGIMANALRNGAVPEGGIMAMNVNETLSAWVKIDIPLDWDPAYWNVCFDSRQVSGPCSTPGGSSLNAQISRDSSGWTIFAEGDDARADLIRDSATNKSRTFSVKGTYKMPFAFRVQCVNSADCL